MAEFTLYGLPMWSVSGAGQRAGAGAAARDAADGSRATVAPRRTTPTPTARPARGRAGSDDRPRRRDVQRRIRRNTPSTDRRPTGTYWSGPDGVQVTHLRPIQPKALVPLDGTTGHGALITELTSDDTELRRPGLRAADRRPDGERARAAVRRRRLPVEAADGAHVRRTPTGLQQQLVLVTGQFFTQPCDHRTRIRRSACSGCSATSPAASSARRARTTSRRRSS